MGTVNTETDKEGKDKESSLKEQSETQSASKNVQICFELYFHHQTSQHCLRLYLPTNTKDPNFMESFLFLIKVFRILSMFSSSFVNRKEKLKEWYKILDEKGYKDNKHNAGQGIQKYQKHC